MRSYSPQCQVFTLAVPGSVCTGTCTVVALGASGFCIVSKIKGNTSHQLQEITKYVCNIIIHGHLIASVPRLSLSLCAARKDSLGMTLSFMCVLYVPHIHKGSSGLVYCGYLDKGGHRDIVAIKTCKGTKFYIAQSELLEKYNMVCHIVLSLASDKEKLLKEVTTMLSFKHPNVMSLIGLCYDEEMPLIIMPYMSNGNVLGYVQKKKNGLHLDKQAKQEEVCIGLSCNRFLQ